MANDNRGENSIAAFLIGLIAGGLGIYAGALIVLGQANITTALTAALIGAVVWGLASTFLGWIPLVGTIITFVVWLGAINWLYTGGWITALQIAIFAWITSLIISYIVQKAGYANPNALGVPGA